MRWGVLNVRPASSMNRVEEVATTKPLPNPRSSTRSPRAHAATIAASPAFVREIIQPSHQDDERRRIGYEKEGQGAISTDGFRMV
jgi:hypothetical protein